MGKEISARQRAEVISYRGARKKQERGRSELKMASFERFSFETRNSPILPYLFLPLATRNLPPRDSPLLTRRDYNLSFWLYLS